MSVERTVRLDRGTARRRAVAVSVAALCITAAGAVLPFTASATPGPSRPVDRSLSSYVLFAFDTLSFKGGETPGRGEIHGGDVGAGGIDTTPNDSNPVMDICANHKVTMDPDTQLVADTMRVTPLCSVWDVFANGLTGGSSVGAAHSGPNAFTTPLLSNPPGFPSFSCDASKPLTVATGGSASFTPGTYGDVDIKDDAHVTFAPGTYNLCSLHVGKHATVETVSGVTLNIEGTFSLSNDTTFGPACDANVFVRSDGATGAHDVAINFSKHTTVSGRFLTTIGNIALGDDNDLYGSFVGESINSDKNVNVNGCALPPATTTSSSSPSSSASSSSSSSSSVSSSSTIANETSSTATTSSTIAQETSTSSTSTTTTTLAPTTTTEDTIPGSGRSTTSTPTTLVGAESSTIAPTTSTTSNPGVSVEGSTTIPAGPQGTVGTTAPGTGPSVLPFTGSTRVPANVAFAALVAGLTLLGLSRRRVFRRPAQ